MPPFDFGEFPVLTTGRISLCEHTADDVDDIFLIRSDAEVQLYNSAPDQTEAGKGTLLFFDVICRN